MLCRLSRTLVKTLRLVQYLLDRGNAHCKSSADVWPLHKKLLLAKYVLPMYDGHTFHYVIKILTWLFHYFSLFSLFLWSFGPDSINMGATEFFLFAVGPCSLWQCELPFNLLLSILLTSGISPDIYINTKCNHIRILIPKQSYVLLFHTHV